jgi:hypothetical protein
MEKMRNLIGVVLAFALAAFAVPAQAQSPQKLHSIDVRPTTPPAASTSPNVFVTISNETPSGGNSTINSVVIIPAAGANVAAPQAGDNPGMTVTKAADGRIYVNGFTGLKSGRRDPYYMTVKLRVTYPSLACGSTYAWSSIAYAGNSFSQETFAPVIGAGTAGVTNMPTNATQTNGCGYKVTVTPTAVAKGSSPTLSATLTNQSTVSISSLALTPPSGITISPTSWTQSFGSGDTTIALTNAKVACNAAGGQWVSSVTPSGFTKSAADPTTTVYGACELVFSSLPTSIVPGQPFSVAIKLNDGDRNAIPGFGATVTLVADGTGCSLASAGSQTASGGVVTINGITLSLTSAPSCALKATATYDSTDFTATSRAVKVFSGVLACADMLFDALAIPAYNPLDPTTFNASPPTADGTEDIAFLVGARSPGDPLKDDCSKDINFTVVNNVATGSASSTDPLDNVVPSGGWSFTWDPTVPNPVVGLITTFRSEWANAEGVSSNATWICTVTPCPGDRVAFPAAWKKLPYCLSTLVTHSSIPAGEAACLARLVETAIPVGDLAYCSGTPPAAPVPPRCIQPTVYTIIGKDPVFIR